MKSGSQDRRLRRKDAPQKRVFIDLGLNGSKEHSGCWRLQPDDDERREDNAPRSAAWIEVPYHARLEEAGMASVRVPLNDADVPLSYRPFLARIRRLSAKLGPYDHSTHIYVLSGQVHAVGQVLPQGELATVQENRFHCGWEAEIVKASS